MSKIKIKFLEDGKWGDHPGDPIFEVEAGDEMEVSARLANIAVESGKARFVRIKHKVEEDKETGPIEKDETTGAKKKAEGKKGKGKTEK